MHYKNAFKLLHSFKIEKKMLNDTTVVYFFSLFMYIWCNKNNKT